jgi:hypothetical protein
MSIPALAGAEYLPERSIYLGGCSSFALRVIKVLPREILKDKLRRSGALACVDIMLVSMFAVRSYNDFFEKTEVEPLRASGAWIPTGKEVVAVDFFRLIGVHRAGSGVNIPDKQRSFILKDMYGDQYEQVLSAGS